MLVLNVTAVYTLPITQRQKDIIYWPISNRIQQVAMNVQQRVPREQSQSMPINPHRKAIDSTNANITTWTICSLNAVFRRHCD